MKHNIKITIILIAMFLVAQFIGLYVINQYSPINQIIYNPTTGQTQNITLNQSLPYGMQPPQTSAGPNLISIIISFAIAITLIFLLTKYKWKFFIKLWFFVVVVLALALALNAFLKNYIPYSALIVLLIALPLGLIKIYRPNFYVHNLTELLIYPGISAVFVPILNIWTIIILLILISIYDIWAVWHSGIMQKMAKFQMNELHILGGFFIPYMSKAIRAKIKKFKLSKSKIKNKKIKISLAILGGGDIVFPIITAGVFMRAFSIIPALFVTFGATAALTYLLFTSEKRKFYPAMPYITSGIFLGLLLWYLLFILI